MKYYTGTLTKSGLQNLAGFCKNWLSEKTLKLCTAKEYANGLANESDFASGPEFDHSVEIPSHHTKDGNPAHYSIPADEIEWEVEEEDED